MADQIGISRTVNITDTVPEPCKVAGLWLKPFCLGHHLLFKRLGFPFAGDALAAADVASQIVPAVAICAGATYEWTLGAMMDGEWEKEVSPWLSAMKKFGDASEAQFRAYLADGYGMPPICKSDPRAPSRIVFSAPWELMLKCRLVSAGFDESAVLNGYLPGRWYDYYTMQEFRQFDSLQRIADEGKVRSPESLWKRIFYTEAEATAIDRVRKAVA